MSINIVYFGSPDFSAEILEHLISTPIADTKVVGVVTNPDKKLGRKQILTPSAVAAVAQNHHLPVFKPEKLDLQNLTHIKLLQPDIFLVAAYGKIIPQTWLDTPRLAPLNVHFSLLPKYRGALCVSEPIKNQEKETGVSLMQIDGELDHGTIYAQLKQKIDINDNTQTLTKKLTHTAIDLLTQNLPRIIDGTLKPTPQDHQSATYTPKTTTNTRANAYIEWSVIKQAQQGVSASQTHALIRSLNPDPGAWTKINDIDLKIITTSLENDQLVLDQVQIPGKNTVSWKQFISGHKIE